MICLIFPNASQLALIGYLQASEKLSVFNIKTKNVEKVIATPKDRTGHPLKKHLKAGCYDPILWLRFFLWQCFRLMEMSIFVSNFFEFK